MKTSLISKPVLKIYDPQAETEVHTDACKQGVAGVLLQKQDQSLHPLAYYSRQTNSAEQNYHSYELETMAVVETIKISSIFARYTF